MKVTIKRIEVRNFRCHKSTVLDDLDRVNILIGPNNAGKSSIFHLFHDLYRYLPREISRDKALFSPQSSMKEDWWWQRQPQSGPIEARFKLAPSQPAPTLFSDDGSIDLVVKITSNPNDSYCTVEVNFPVKGVSIEGKTYREFFTKSKDKDKDNYLVIRQNDEGKYLHKSIPDNQDSFVELKYVKEVYECFLESFKFFDAIRSFDRNPKQDSSLAIEGTKILSDLNSWANDKNRVSRWDNFKRRVVEIVNAIGNSIYINKLSDFEVKEYGNTLKVPLKWVDRHDTIFLEHSGTGFSEIFFFACDLAKREKKGKTTYFVEEPECHLHPRLVYNLMQTLSKQTHIQFFISTHSSVLLSAIDKKATSVYHFSLMSDGRSKVSRCKELVQYHDLLDDLGISARSILQCNCIIWVEGPSDRVYLNRWFREKGITEHIDFEYDYYGGKILKHYTLEEAEDMINVTKICSNSIVLMDRDGPPGDDNLGKAKQTILDEAQRDTNRRRAFVTLSREVENEVDSRVFRKAIAELLKKDVIEFELDGNERFPVEIVKAYGIGPDKEETVLRKLGANKVDLAKLVSKQPLLSDEQVPPYISEMIEFIKRHNN